MCYNIEKLRNIIYIFLKNIKNLIILNYYKAIQK